MWRRLWPYMLLILEASIIVSDCITSCWNRVRVIDWSFTRHSLTKLLFAADQTCSISHPCIHRARRQGLQRYTMLSFSTCHVASLRDCYPAPNEPQQVREKARRSRAEECRERSSLRPEPTAPVPGWGELGSSPPSYIRHRWAVEHQVW